MADDTGAAEGPEGPGGPVGPGMGGRGGFRRGFGSGIQGQGRGQGWVEAVELAEARPRIRSGSLSPSWAAWSRT